jgi:hypothetical protein
MIPNVAVLDTNPLNRPTTSRPYLGPIARSAMYPAACIAITITTAPDDESDPARRGRLQ